MVFVVDPVGLLDVVNNSFQTQPLQVVRPGIADGAVDGENLEKQ